MIPRILRFAAVVSAALFAASPSDAQARSTAGAIDGVVTDTNLVSLGDATASILGSSIQVVTGANGRFRILGLPAGHYILIVRRLGYAPTSTALQVAGGDTVRMSFALERIAASLDTVAITAKIQGPRMAEFEERRKLGFGQFMTQAEIEKRNSVSVSDLVRTFTGVDVIVGPLGRANVVSHRFRGSFNQASCPLQIFVDDVALPAGTDLNGLATPKDLAGMEVYLGPATIPLEYKTTGGAWCGIILIWTRGG